MGVGNTEGKKRGGAAGWGNKGEPRAEREVKG